MIKTWIKNDATLELRRAFAFSSTAKALWESVKDKYGQRNGILLSKLKRELTNLKQGQMSLTDYYTQMCELIGEIEIIQPVCGYICDGQQTVLGRTEQDYMILFFNELNDCYETVRNQILLTDLLPTMSKAFSLILQIKQQNEAYQNKSELNVFNLNTKRDESVKKPYDKKRNQADKKYMVCEFCKKMDHGRDTCFMCP